MRETDEARHLPEPRRGTGVKALARGPARPLAVAQAVYVAPAVRTLRSLHTGMLPR